MECLSFCLGERFDLANIDNLLADNSQYLIEKYWGGLKLTKHNQPEHRCFVFNNGTLITWNVKRYQSEEYIALIEPALEQPIGKPILDEFTYMVDEQTTMKPHEYYDIDVITIDDDTDNAKLSMSYALSQSVKLQYYEQRLEDLIAKYTPLTQELQSHGRLRIPRKRIRKIIGEIVAAKCEINLTSNFLYQPKFFWQHPSLEDYYHLCARYLDIAARTKNINHRLDTLTEIFEMFNGYLENRHSHNLEVIIIVLIMLEIIFGILNLHF